MTTKYENFKTVPLEFYFLAGMKVLVDSAMESMAALISFGRCTLVYVKLAVMLSQISLYSLNVPLVDIFCLYLVYLPNNS